MIYLLDVNALLAALITEHPHHAAANGWLEGKELATCPLSELGFLRIATQPKAFGISMKVAREAIEDFVQAHSATFIPADLPAIESNAADSDAVTDQYLAELAARQKMRLATFDTGIKHAAVELIA
jgi:uncharacterized protein